MPKRPKSSVWVDVAGATTLLNAADIYADDHPLVRARPELFEDVMIIGARVDDAPVEQATAAPGERRRTPRSR